MQDKAMDGMIVMYVQLLNLCIEVIHPLGENGPMGAVTLMRTQVVVTSVWFCVSNILEKKIKTPNGICFHIMLFSMY
jgi:hypothetical protein